MRRRLPLAAGLAVALLAVGTAPGLAAPAPSAGTWTPYPVKGFAGGLAADQPKLDTAQDGTVTAAWFGGLGEKFARSVGNVLVSSYDGQSWSCPISLPGTTPPSDGVPPAFDVGADGTIAVAGNNVIPNPFAIPQPAEQDVWVSIRRPGAASFTGAGTGIGFPASSDPVVATSAVRTVAVWVSGANLMGAQFLPGATKARPVVLASGDELAFPKLRMDQAGNAVAVYRSSVSGELQQNWLLWPAGSAASPAQAFPIGAPDDFVESAALSVSPGGRMIIAMYNGAVDGSDPQAVDFVGTTTSGFGAASIVVSGDPLPATNFVTAIDDGGDATVAFRMDEVGASEATARIYKVDPVSGTAGAVGAFSEPGDTGIYLFRALQDGPTVYLSWSDSNLNALNGGVVSFDGSSVTREMATSQSDWIGVVAGPRGPVAYWPKQLSPEQNYGQFVSTLPHTPLNAKLANTTVRVKKSGAISVSGKVTPSAAASACTGAAVAIWVQKVDKYNPSGTMGQVVVKPNGTYSWAKTDAALKGCSQAKVTAYLQTPDAVRPISTTTTVRCTR